MPPGVKLSVGVAKLIRERALSDERPAFKTLAKEYGVGYTSIYSVIMNRTYVDEEYGKKIIVIKYGRVYRVVERKEKIKANNEVALNVGRLNTLFDELYKQYENSGLEREFNKKLVEFLNKRFDK
jgi:hypothetical protein